MATLKPEEFYNPYQAPEFPQLAPDFSILPDQATPGVSYFWVKLCIYLQALVVFVGIGLATNYVESILGSGAVLFFVGLLTAFVSIGRDLKWSVLFGLSGPLFSLFMLGLINVLSWSPSEAQFPVPIIGTAYFMFSAFPAVVVLLEIRTRESGLASEPAKQR